MSPIKPVHPKEFVEPPVDTVLCTIKPCQRLKGYDVFIGGLQLYSSTVEQGRQQAVIILKEAIRQLEAAKI